ncbi:MAG: hypothetical protein Q9174_004701 [Haloplaca sp. 1 TL-2023]
MQPESGPAVQAFLQWAAEPRIRRTGCSGPENSIGSSYISRADLQHYLTTERIRLLLQEVFHNTTDQSPPNADRVRSTCLRSFAILLVINYPSMIRFFVDRHQLRDTCLPFETEPKHFPKSQTHNIFEAFQGQQWQFCAVQLEYDMSENLSDDSVMPFTTKEEIASGGSAILYKITVDEAYNTLKPVDDASTEIKSQSSNTFALKTYRQSPDAQEDFENERNAFIRLRYGDRPPDNIIQYYGSFIRGGTYSILLEYADLGTLDNYMEKIAAPTNESEIGTFWRNFLPSMLHGLAHIHGTHGPASDGQNILIGWHHDIDPSNILVLSRGHDSPYDCNFKIADLGLAHFKQYLSSATNPTDYERYGMSAYGM